MTPLIQVLILCGGRSDEHEISLISAKCVLDALDRTRYQPILVGVSKKGVWHLEHEDSFFTGEFRADKIKLNESAPRVTLAPYLSPSGRGRLEKGGEGVEFDVVFPLIHGQFGEDGTLQGLFDIVGVPYVGAGCGSSWICMDKALAKTLLRHAGIPVADWVMVNSVSQVAPRKAEIEKLGFPCFVKPSRQGSSVGVSKVASWAELEPAVASALKYDDKCLIERGIVGREIECAVLGLSKKPEASLPGEIVVSKKIGWYSYEAKYLLPDGAETLAPAPLDAATTLAVQELSKRVFTTLECDGMARVDLFLEEATGKLYLNEVNTIPGFTPISMYPKMWQVSGLSYAGLINRLLELARERKGK